MTRIILVSYAGNVECVLVVNDDEVDTTIAQLQEANADNEDPVDIKEYGPPDSLANAIGYIQDP